MIKVSEKLSYDLEIAIDYNALTVLQVDAIFEAIEEFCLENAIEDSPVWESDDGIVTDFCLTGEQADILRRKILQAIN